MLCKKLMFYCFSKYVLHHYLLHIRKSYLTLYFMRVMYYLKLNKKVENCKEKKTNSRQTIENLDVKT